LRATQTGVGFFGEVLGKKQTGPSRLFPSEAPRTSKMLRDVFSDWRTDTKDLLVLGVPVMLANAMRIAFFVTNNAFIVRLKCFSVFSPFQHLTSLRACDNMLLIIYYIVFQTLIEH
jgi:hypothetical protein